MASDIANWDSPSWTWVLTLRGVFTPTHRQATGLNAASKPTSLPKNTGDMRVRCISYVKIPDTQLPDTAYMEIQSSLQDGVFLAPSLLFGPVTKSSK